MEILLYPPFAFIIALIILFIFAKIIKGFEPRVQKNPETSKTYGCGEDVEPQKTTPSYEEFYPYAIFFTVLHVVALMLMTLAFATQVPFIIPLTYVLIVIIILSILFIG